MTAVSERDLRRCLVNCSRGEATAMTLPKELAGFDWDGCLVLGWRDPKAPLRGYLVRWLDGELVGVSLRAAESRMSGRIAAMCLLCQTVHAGNEVSLFTAWRAGQAGRDGNTIGNYMCADLTCAGHLRSAVRAPDDPDPDASLRDRIAAMAERLDAFIREVRRPQP